MMAFYTATTTSSFRSTTTIFNVCSFTLLFVVLLSTTVSNVVVNADTIFSEIMPTKCVNPALNIAGFCVLTHECTITRGCFESSNIKQPTSTTSSTSSTLTGATTANTNRLSLDIEGFYVPVDAVDCEQFEDPMCPATTCCPECQVELNELYKCFIMETAGLNYLDYLASSCPLDCTGYGSGSGPIVPVPVTTTAPVPVPVPVTTIAPVPVPVATTTAPVPVATTIAPVPVPAATTIAPVPVVTTIAPVPVPVVTTIAPVPVLTAAPFNTIGLVDPDTSNSTTYLGFGELIVDGEDDVVIEEVIEEEIITSSNITTSEKVKIGAVAADIP
jgi:hypothetical protein